MVAFRTKFKNLQQTITEENLQIEARESFCLEHSIPFQLSIFDIFNMSPVAKAVNDTLTAITYFHKPANHAKLDYVFEGAGLFVNAVKGFYSGNPLSENEIDTLLDFRGIGGIARSLPKLQDSLASIMPGEDFRSLLRSINTSYFTPPRLIESVWNILIKLGLPEHSLILDPSIGSGSFTTYAPPAMHGKFKMVGVERDPFTAKLARAIQPEIDLFNTSLESADFQEYSGRFDAALSNIPFGDIDAQSNDYGRMRIHNYFFRRCMDEIKSGGFVAFIVSRYFMDSKNSEVREALAQQCGLVAAFRLPNNVFNDYAATDTVSDLIILQKDSAASSIDWVNTSEIELEGNTTRLNDYFINNPDNILGDVTVSNYQSRWSVSGDLDSACIDLDTQTAALDNIYFSSNDLTPKTTSCFTKDTLNISSLYQYGELFKSGAKVYLKGADLIGRDGERIATIKEIELNAQNKERLYSYCDIKFVLNELIEAERADLDVFTLNKLRTQLKQSVELFHKNFGALNRAYNKRTFKLCSKQFRVLALESNYTPAISAQSAKKQATSPRAESFKLSKILNGRVISPYKPATKATNAKEALIISMYERGYVDLKHISQLSKLSESSIIVELDGLIFKNPETGYWESKEEYLSGHVVQKYKIAEEKNSQGQFDRNLHFLEKVKPQYLPFEQIIIPFGASWVPSDIYKAFFTHVTGDTTPEHTFALGKHHIRINATTAFNAFSTSVVNVTTILQKAINAKPVVVTRPTEKNGTTINLVDNSASLAANTKVDEIKSEWQNWLGSDIDRKETLTQIYNNTFNVISNADSEVNWLQSSGCTMQPRSHQIRIAQRGVTAKTLMVDAAVGSGKSLIAAMIAIEKKRLFNTRTMLVAPNHTVPQLGVEIQEAYPGADIIILSTEDLSADNRRSTLHRIAQSDFDLCIIPASSFKLIPMDAANQLEFIRREQDELQNALNELEEYSFTTKNIQKKLEKLEHKIQVILNKTKDYSITFEDLCIDTLIVDEAQQYKNLAFTTNHTDIGGLGNPMGSDTAFDMYSKVQFLLSKNSGSVIFMTGTPIMNSVSELYTWFKYLKHDVLSSMGLLHFDSFSGVFCQPCTDYELSPSGRGFKLKTRIKLFTNVPELQAIYFNFAEVVTADELVKFLPTYHGKPAIPPLKNNAPTRVFIEPDCYQEAIFDEISTHAQDLKKHNTNMLELMYRGRMASIDPRILNPNATFNPEGKLATLAKNVYQKYCEFSAESGTQIVFCDSSVSNKHKSQEIKHIAALQAAALEGDINAEQELEKYDDSYILSLHNTFSAYDEIKHLLVELGVRPEEIAFIQDYKTPIRKMELKNKMNSGEIRVLIASTFLGGSGLNVNKKLVALHHVDIPYRSGDIVQRNGRAIRQGNEIYMNNLCSFELEIFFYGVRRTLDAWFFALVETKTNLINSFRTANIYNRSIQEVESDDITFAELKAHLSENPLLLKQVKLSSEFKKLDAAKRSADARIFGAKYEFERINNSLIKNERSLKEYLSVLNEVNQHKKTHFEIEIKGKTYFEKGKIKKKIDTQHTGKALDALNSAIQSNLYKSNCRELIGRYLGHDIYHVKYPIQSFSCDHANDLELVNDSGFKQTLKFASDAKVNNMYDSLVNYFDYVSAKQESCVRYISDLILRKSDVELFLSTYSFDDTRLNEVKQELDLVNIQIAADTDSSEMIKLAS